MKKTLLVTLSLLLALVVSAQEEQLYGVYQGSGTIAGIGTGKAETYDVAYHITDPSLAGLEIRGINVPVQTNAPNITDYKAWLSTNLTIENNKNVPDIVSVDFTPDGKWANVTFEKPYLLTEEGVYVGYTLTVSSIDVNRDNDPGKTPIMCFSSTATDELYIHSTRTERKWKRLAESSYLPAGRAYAFVVRLGGDPIKKNAAAFSAPDELTLYALTGQQKSLSLMLSNHGTSDITRITCEIDIDGEVTQQVKATNLKGTYYGQHSTVKLTLPALDTPGSRHVNIRIAKVNEVDNEDLEPAIDFNIAIIDKTPTHKPLMEEYTGGWCGWCPRGMAAMEAMTSRHPDDFIGVAYHNGDPMQITLTTPNTPSGYPHAFIDRVITGRDEQGADRGYDPFFGSSNGGSLGIEKDWKTRQGIFTPVSLELEAEWADGDSTAIIARSHSTFVNALKHNPFRLAYILVADDLHNTTREWAQANYYAGTSSSDPYLKPLTTLAGTIRDLHFNDVAVQLSCPGPTALAESLPEQVVDGKPYEHTYTFDISKNSLIQDKSKLRVVVVLINTLTREVSNAEKATVPSGETNGIASPTTDATAVSSTTFDLAGRPVGNARRGIVIQRQVLSDGTARTRKVVLP